MRPAQPRRGERQLRHGRLSHGAGPRGQRRWHQVQRPAAGKGAPGRAGGSPKSGPSAARPEAIRFPPSCLLLRSHPLALRGQHCPGGHCPSALPGRVAGQGREPLLPLCHLVRAAEPVWGTVPSEAGKGKGSAGRVKFPPNLCQCWTRSVPALKGLSPAGSWGGEGRWSRRRRAARRCFSNRANKTCSSCQKVWLEGRALELR